ncbi:MAG TPA: DUF2332 family protein [Burkholderiales bacterium]|jgi:hypothetical protein|nr:DUF2332 family protein [Burkholderiales bacterium]
MDRVRLIAELARQRAYCECRSPLYAAVLRELEADAAAGSPPWLERIEAAWRDRTFAVGWEAAHLLLAAMHYWALKGDAAELAEIYPSCGGPGGAPRGAAKGFLRRAPSGFWEKLRLGLVQTNEIDRSIAWMLAAGAAFRTPGMAFHLVELGTSAGLNLVGDHLPHECRFASETGGSAPAPADWNGAPHRILTRAGLDLRPRRLEDPADRLWLKACVWADDLARLERLERATQVFLQLAREPSGPRLERCAFSEAPDWLAANRPPRHGEGLLVFNSIATIYLGDAEYADLQRAMARVLAPWGSRGLWVEYERARGAREGPLELCVHRALHGRLDTRLLGSGAPRPQEIRLRGGWEALSAGSS